MLDKVVKRMQYVATGEVLVDGQNDLFTHMTTHILT